MLTWTDSSPGAWSLEARATTTGAFVSVTTLCDCFDMAMSRSYRVRGKKISNFLKWSRLWPCFAGRDYVWSRLMPSVVFATAARIRRMNSVRAARSFSG